MICCSKNLKESGSFFILLAVLILSVFIAIYGLFAGKRYFIKSDAKEIVQWCRKWESAQLNYYFRLDKLAGDINRNGIIADEENPVSPLRELIKVDVIDKSKIKHEAGDSIFHIKIGHDIIEGRKKNVFVICPSSDCLRTLDYKEVEMMEIIDNIIDGEALAADGDLRGIAGVTLKSDGEAVVDVREGISLSNWNDPTYVGAAYYFEDYR